MRVSSFADVHLPVKILKPTLDSPLEIGLDSGFRRNDRRVSFWKNPDEVGMTEESGDRFFTSLRSVQNDIE